MDHLRAFKVTLWQCAFPWRCIGPRVRNSWQLQGDGSCALMMWCPLHALERTRLNRAPGIQACQRDQAFALGVIGMPEAGGCPLTRANGSGLSGHVPSHMHSEFL